MSRLRSFSSEIMDGYNKIYKKENKREEMPNCDIVLFPREHFNVSLLKNYGHYKCISEYSSYTHVT